LISTFLDFAKPKEPHLVNCDLREVLEKTLLLLSPQAKTQGVEIRREIPQEPLQASVDPDQMRQAFTNLGINALEAMPEGGILKIDVLENARDKVSIRFIDTGSGIPKEAQSKIFDPFFTTKEGGTGLGLSIAHRIVTQHGGNLAVEGGQARGCIFTITLPMKNGV
jgi:signal transduction histidine kinase